MTPLFSRPYNGTPAFDGGVWNDPAGFTPLTGCSHRTFWSRTMHKMIGYVVFLPSGYPAAAPYNVIYFLTGGQGTENSFYSAALAHYAAAQQVVVVFPNGDHTFWNDAVPGADMYSSYMTTSGLLELFAIIENLFLVKTTKGGRAITGSSGGGHAALRMALKYPEKFSSCYPYCPPLYIDSTYLTAPDATDAARLLHVFNNTISSWAPAQTPQGFANSNTANIISQGLALKFVCGDADTGNYADNQAFDSLLTSLSIPHTFVTATGVAHNQAALWAFEGGHLDLDFMWSHFS